MSLYTALRQVVSPSAGSSSDESTATTFDADNTSSNSSVDSLLRAEHHDPTFRIRQRLEASRQGMLQLEVLRNKHQKLMQEMRIRWPQSTVAEQLNGGCSEKHGISAGAAVNPQAEVKLNDFRCDSPVSCCVSHRSSLSMDSGCVSLSSDLSSQSPMPYSAYRKFSLEDQQKKAEQNVAIAELAIDENPRLVATAIESTTALRFHGPKRYAKNNWPRPKSVCSNYPDENAVVVDSLSFSQITPPPIHRKFTTVGRSESVQTRRPCLVRCTDVHSIISPRKEQSSIRVSVNQSSVLCAKPISIPLSTKMPASPYTRLRNPQQPLQNTRVAHADSQAIFHASRIFVDRSPHAVQRPKQSVNSERYDSEEESPRPLRAEPAIVLSRQHSSESSPCESRKVHLIESSNSFSNITVLGYHHQLNRCESSLSSETIVAERPRRRMKEKNWKESEGL